MKVNYKAIIVLLLVITGSLSCKSKGTKKMDNDLPRSVAPKIETDTVSAESQVTNLGKKKKKFFLDSNIVRAAVYCFLDVHDYEDDSMTRGQLLNIMPNYAQYLWKYDAHPKVALTKLQTLQLLSIINSPKNYSYGASFCYYPRNCVCFYNSKDEIVGFFEICFECSRVQSIPEFGTGRKGGLSERGVSEFNMFFKSAGITILKGNVSK